MQDLPLAGIQPDELDELALLRETVESRENPVHLLDAFGEARRTWLQDVGRLDFEDTVVRDRGHVVPCRNAPRSSPSSSACRTTTPG